MDRQMQKKLSILIGLGVIFLIIGIGLVLYAPSFSVDNVAVGKAAKSAQEAAFAISSNNQKEIMVNNIGMFSIGVGIMLAASGVILKHLKPKTK